MATTSYSQADIDAIAKAIREAPAPRASLSEFCGLWAQVKPVISYYNKVYYFWWRKKIVNVAFVSAQRRDMLLNSGGKGASDIDYILATLIFSVRFKESIKEMVEHWDISDDKEVVGLVNRIDRNLTLMEQEAQQYGIPVSRDPNLTFDSPLLKAIPDEKDRNTVYKSLKDWRKIRTNIVTVVRRREKNSGANIGTMRVDLDPNEARKIVEAIRSYLDANYVDNIKLFIRNLALQFDLHVSYDIPGRVAAASGAPSAGAIS